MTDFFLIGLYFIRLLVMAFCASVITTILNGGTVPPIEQMFVITIAVEVARLGAKARRHD